MFHQSSKQIFLGIFVALLLITMPVYAVKNYKFSNYAGGHQIWFEVEDFDERDPDDDSSFALSDEPGAFGRSISSVSSTDGASMISYTFDISKADGRGGTWYFWGRVINPNSNSDFMLVDGHPGDQVPFTLPVSGLSTASQRVFEESAGSPGNWAWSGDNHNESHTKTLQDGENTMYILNREIGAIWDVFMWTDDPDYVPTDEDYINAVAPSPGAASDPSPANEATDVPRDVTLSWTPGAFVPAVNGHTVYFSESFEDVNEGIGGITQNAASYAPPQRLDFEKTYYWRVDEVNGPPDFTVHPGEVWQFTTEPFIYPIENIIGTASSQFNENQGPENTINGSGLDENDLHSTDETGIWVSSMTGAQPTWIQYEFDLVCKLNQMWVWNFNQKIESVAGFGFKDVTIEYSVDGASWATLGTTHEFARASGTPGYAHNTTVDFGVPAKYIRLTANSNWGGILPQYGLSEVRFFYIPLHAREPNPDSGATNVDVDVTLSWRAGREAAEHDVYLSSDEQAVTDGTAPVTTVSQAQHGPLSLDLGQTYFWKVNEVNMAETPATWESDLWSFVTPEYLIVDDFEDYNDYPPDEIFSTWIDGWGVPANGAMVAHDVAPWAETDIVHGGGQSMPFFYNNTGGATYSEAERAFAAPQDWTKHGVQSLVLYFHGNPGNTGQLYVKLNNSKVVYDGDAADIATLRWKQWNIDLASFGMNLQSVTKLAIGIDGNGATGTLYVDDIRLYRLAPQPQTN